MLQPPTGTIEVVDGAPADADAEQVLALWEQAGVASGDQAREQLARVVCLLRAEGGQVEGASWAHPDDVPLIGGRRFWMYNAAVPAGSPESGDALLEHTFEALAATFDPDARDPIGVCVLIHDRAEMERRSDAVWEHPRMVYAGYRDDGAQVRVGYFPEARI